MDFPSSLTMARVSTREHSKRTQQRKPRYHVCHPCPPPDPKAFSPITIEQESPPSLFSIYSQCTCLDKAQGTSPHYWTPTETPEAFLNIPPISQCIIGKNPPTEQNCHTITQELSTQTLLAYSDGS